MNKLILIGFILLTVSLYNIFLMAREEWLNNIVYKRYSITECFETQDGQRQLSQTPLIYVWHGQKVVLSDNYEKGKYHSGDRRRGRVKIMINGRNYSSPWLVEIRPNDHDVNRYWMQVMLVKFDDKKAHTECLVILQSYPDFDIHEYTMFDPDALTCRALFIHSNGQVVENVFPFSQRTSPLYRTLLAGEVSPEQLGFYSDVLEQWPFLFDPVLFPFISGIAGLIMLIIGLVKYRKASKSV